MTRIMLTRFNNDTWEQLQNYREKHKIKGAIYGVPLRIAETVPLKANVFVMEANIQLNKIMGVSIIHNFIKMDKRHRIFADQNYNRFVYMGKRYIPRCNFTREEMVLIEKMERLVFKGKGHLKRGQGIQHLPFVRYTKDDLEAFKLMFSDRAD
jgi:hypothetical protein